MTFQNDGKCIFQTVCPHAHQLFVAGEFNGWSTTATPMERVGDHTWQVSLDLEPGTYRFRYVTDDGRWLTDFSAFGVEPNKNGGWDSVVLVPGEREDNETAAPAQSVGV